MDGTFSRHKVRT